MNKYQELSAELEALQEIGTTPAPHKRAELEELILEQDKGNAMLRDNIFKLRQEIRLGLVTVTVVIQMSTVMFWNELRTKELTSYCFQRSEDGAKYGNTKEGKRNG